MYCISYRTSFIAIFWITQSSAIFWITQICVQGACSHVNSKRGVTSSAASLVMASELPLIGISHMLSFLCPNALFKILQIRGPTNLDTRDLSTVSYQFVWSAFWIVERPIPTYALIWLCRLHLARPDLLNFPYSTVHTFRSWECA